MVNILAWWVIWSCTQCNNRANGRNQKSSFVDQEFCQIAEISSTVDDLSPFVFQALWSSEPKPGHTNKMMDMPLGDGMVLSMGRTHNHGVSNSAWQSVPLWCCTAAASIPQQNLLHWATEMPTKRLLLGPQGTLTSEQWGFGKKNWRRSPEWWVCRVSIWRLQRSVWASCLNSTQVREEPYLGKVSLKLYALWEPALRMEFWKFSWQSEQTCEEPMDWLCAFTASLTEILQRCCKCAEWIHCGQGWGP